MSEQFPAVELPPLEDHFPITKGDRLEDFPCPNCGETHDILMDRPAMKSVGYNTRSGMLFDCSCCETRVTEAEMRLEVRNPWNKGEMDHFDADRTGFINPDLEDIKEELEQAEG